METQLLLCANITDQFSKKMKKLPRLFFSFYWSRKILVILLPWCKKSYFAKYLT